MIRSLELNENTLGMDKPHKMINIYVQFSNVMRRDRSDIQKPNLNCRVYEMKNNQWVVIG